MISRVKEYLSRNAATPLNYSDIDVSNPAKKILENQLDSETSQVLLDFLRPLPQTYRSPELFLSRVIQEPILTITSGYQLDPSIPMRSYVLPFGFSPTERGTGQCGSISKWLLYDIQMSGLADQLDSSVDISMIKGNSPTFFNQLGSIHSWVNIKGKNGDWGLLLDPSFGRIRGLNEAHGYHSMWSYKVKEEVENGLFESTGNIRINGTEVALPTPGTPPGSQDMGSMPAYILGLSRNEKYCFGLGVETLRDKPFLALITEKGEPHGLYWFDEVKAEEPRIVSKTRQSYDSMMRDDPGTRHQVSQMLQIMRRFQFQEVSPTIN